MIFPKRIPILYQILLKGVKRLEFNNPSIKKTKLVIINQCLMALSENIGHIPIKKNTTKKTTPKLRFELISILFLCFII